LPFPFLGNYRGQDVHPPDDCSRHPDQTVDIPHEEQKKKWYDLDDKRKKELEVSYKISLLSLNFFSETKTHDPLVQIGGGLLAGAALIGGGYYAWHEHEKRKTEEEVSFFPQHYYSHFFSLTRTFVNKETKPHVGCAGMAT
jgi:hypothetical protein